MQIQVGGNDVNQTFRSLERKIQREGIFGELRSRRSHEKPSERRVREMAETARRHRKMLRKRMERLGY